MMQETKNELSDFLAKISNATVKYLVADYKIQSIRGIDKDFSKIIVDNVIEDIVTYWHAVGNSKKINGNFNDLMSILLINLIGPLNRLPLPENIEKTSFVHSYMTLIDKTLSHDRIRTKFSGLMEQTLKAA